MTRLTDEHLDALERALAAIESEYTPTCRSAPYGNGCPGATDESIEFWRRAADCSQAMITELRERRAADLTAFERMALHSHRDRLNANELEDRALVAVLDKLLAAAEGK